MTLDENKSLLPKIKTRSHLVVFKFARNGFFCFKFGAKFRKFRFHAQGPDLSEKANYLAVDQAQYSWVRAELKILKLSLIQLKPLKNHLNGQA